MYACFSLFCTSCLYSVSLLCLFTMGDNSLMSQFISSGSQPFHCSTVFHFHCITCLWQIKYDDDDDDDDDE